MRLFSDRGVLIIFLLGAVLLIYQMLPGPTSIRDFPGLPSSAKSTLEGDTVQVPNVSAYFSDNYRRLATNFYLNAYVNLSRVFIPPLRLNYPPEVAYTAIKDQTQSTYLEEYVYPLRNSLYVNGLEPFDESGAPRYWGSTKFAEGGNLFLTKVTLRFYPSSIVVRFIVWLGILLSSILLWKMAKQVVFNE